MPDQTHLEVAKIAVVSLFSGGIAILGFSTKYQTKGGCKKAHDSYELTQLARRETQAANLEVVATQQSAMHEDIQEIKSLLNKIAGDIYVPRGLENTRRTD